MRYRVSVNTYYIKYFMQWYLKLEKYNLESNKRMQFEVKKYLPIYYLEPYILG